MAYPFFTTQARHALLQLSVWTLGAWPLASSAQAGAPCLPHATQVMHRNACAVQAFQAADTAQSIVYADVMRTLSARERPALRKDQTRWSRQRTAHCKAQHAHQETWEHWSALYHTCLRHYTEQRRAALLHWIHHGKAPD